jgi:YD repeat-containing protein
MGGGQNELLFHAMNAASHSPRLLCVLVFLVAVPWRLSWAQTEGSLPVEIEFTTTAVGDRLCLSWHAEPGVQYVVERASKLGAGGGAGGFKSVAVVTADGTSCTWVDPEPRMPPVFYRLVMPQAEVLALEPPVLSVNGGTILVRGQRLPAGAQLMLSITGQAPVFVTLVPVVGQPDLWRAEVAAGAVAGIVVGAIYAASIVSAGGEPVCPVSQTVEVTETGFASDAPARVPPSIRGIEVANSGSYSLRKGYQYYMAKADYAASALAIWGGKKGYDYYQARSDSAASATGLAIFGTKKGYDYYQAQSDVAHRGSSQPRIVENKRTGLPGEVCFEMCPLSLAVPAGPPLDCVLTYRSKVPSGSSSFFGPNWTCSYDISVTTVPANAGAAATRVRVCDGDGRCDTYFRQADGSFTCPGMFRVGRFSGNTFSLTFGDKTRWVFRPVGTAPGAGKIASIVDSFGVSLLFDYSAGQLSAVSSQFGQWLIFVRGATGLVESVEDHTGRVVSFTYHSGGPDGNAGMLATCSCPHLFGTVPPAGPTTFTYSTGCPEPRCDNNLLTCRDGLNRPLCLYTYSSSSDPMVADFDCVLTERCTDSSAVQGSVCSYAFSSTGLVVYDNDPVGRVTRCTFDRQHRPVEVVQYTGFSTAGLPVTSSSNLPTAPLRAGDPASFTTTLSYNLHHLCTRCVEPDGLETRCVFSCDLNRVSCPAVERGNLRVCTLVPTVGEARSITMEYLPGFGGPEPSSAVCGNPIGGLTIKGGKNPGGSMSVSGRSILKSYFETGDKPNQEQFGIKIRGHEECDDGNDISAVIKVNRTKGEQCDDGNINDYSRGIVVGREECDDGNHDSAGISLNSLPPGEPIIRGLMAMNGISSDSLIIFRDDGTAGDRIGLNGLPPGVPWTKVQDHNSSRSNKTGNRAAVQDHNSSRSNKSGSWNSGFSPTGGGAMGKVGPKQKQWLCSNFRGGSGLGARSMGKVGTKQKAWMLSNFRTSMTTTSGQTYTATFDSHGACLSTRTPIEGAGCDFTYNDLGQLTSVTTLDGPASSFRDELVYDELSSFCTGAVCDKKTDGSGLRLTETCVLDELGRVTSYTDALGFTSTCVYNSLDQCVSVSSPPVGTDAISASPITTTFVYDGGSLLERVDEEHRSAEGSLDAGNPRYTTFYIRDSASCPLAVSIVATEDRPLALEGVPTPKRLAELAVYGLSNFCVCESTFDGAGQCVQQRCPAESISQPTDLVRACSFDERGLLYRRVEGTVGTTQAITTQWDYNGTCDVTRCAVLGTTPAQDIVSTCAYDAFRRLTLCVSPMGNEQRMEYDEHGNVTCSLYGEVTDVPGSSGNVLLSESRLKVWQLMQGQSSSSARRHQCLGFFDEVSKDDWMTVSRFTPGSTAAPVVETTVCVRSPAGLVRSVTRDGVTLGTCTYDGAGRLVTCSDGACSFDFTLDGCGQVTACTRTDVSSRAGVTSKTYVCTSSFDAIGRCVSSSIGGQTTTCAFDSLSRITSYIPAGREDLRLAYDGGGAMSPYSIIVEADLDGDGTYDPISSRFCPGGVCKSSTDHNGYSTSLTLDSLGRCVRVDHPDGTFETSVFDKFGRCISSTSQNGAVFTRDFDADSRVISVVCTDATSTAVPQTSLHYNGMGLCTQMTQGTSDLQWTYDSLGCPLSESQNGQLVQYAYADRTCIRRVYAGTAYDQEVDAQGRVISISAEGATTALATFTYSGHRLASETRSNGVTTTYEYRGEGDSALVVGDLSYDECVRCVVTGPGGVVLSSTTCSRDAAGDVVAESTAFSNVASPPLRGHLYTRDALGRITSEQIRVRTAAGGQITTASSEAYTLDLQGNRLSVTGGRNPGLYTMNDAIPPGDRQMQQYSTWPGGSLVWNDSGSLISLGGSTPTTCTYDACQRLVTATTGTQIVTFTYDACDRLRTQSISISGAPPVTSTFLYDNNYCIRVMADDGQADFTSAPGRLCILSRNGSYVYPHHHGASFQGGGMPVVKMTSNSSGASLEHLDYDQAGQPAFLTSEGILRPGASSSLSIGNWLSSDALWCPESGLYHAGSDAYSPVLCRRVSR